MLTAVITLLFNPSGNTAKLSGTLPISQKKRPRFGEVKSVPSPPPQITYSENSSYVDSKHHAFNHITELNNA